MKFVLLLCLLAMSAAHPSTYGVANEMRRIFPNGPSSAQSFDVKQRGTVVRESSISTRSRPANSEDEDLSWMFQNENMYKGPIPKYEGKKELYFPIHHQRKPALPAKPTRRGNNYYY